MVESRNGLIDCRKGLAVVFLFFVSFLRDMLLSRLDAAVGDLPGKLQLR